MNNKIIWSKDASEDLEDTITYINERSGKKIASEIYIRIISHVEKLLVFPGSGHMIPELLSIGITDIREIVENPWRIIYRIIMNEILIISVVDGRRNVEEILYKKVIDGKIV